MTCSTDLSRGARLSRAWVFRSRCRSWKRCALACQAEGGGSNRRLVPSADGVRLLSERRHDGGLETDGRRRDFKLGPTLSAFEPFKSNMLVFSNLADNNARGGGAHACTMPAYLSGESIYKTMGNDIRAARHLRSGRRAEDRQCDPVSRRWNSAAISANRTAFAIPDIAASIRPISRGNRDDAGAQGGEPADRLRSPVRRRSRRARRRSCSNSARR